MSLPAVFRRSNLRFIGLNETAWGLLRRNDINNRFKAELNRYQRFRVYRARFDQPDAL
jgi:hypothetical protein